MRRLDSVLSLLWKPLARLVYASPHCSPVSQRDRLALAGSLCDRRLAYLSQRALYVDKVHSRCLPPPADRPKR